MTALAQATGVMLAIKRVLAITLSPRRNLTGLVEGVSVQWRNRGLAMEMVRRDLRGQFAGQFLGAFWIFGHPILQFCVYIFIFAVVFKTKIDRSADLPRDYTTYILVGLVPWLFIQQSLARTSTSLMAQANLVKQVVFPIEVLPFCAVLVSLVPLVVGLATIATYTLLTQGLLPWTYILLPVVLLLSVFLMTGIGLMLAAATPFFRDLKDMIQVVTMIGVYVIPAFYLPQWVPEQLRFVLYCNPFSYVIWVFQDVLYFGHVAHPWSWLIFAIGSLVTLTLGYRAFRAIRIYIADVL
jgi:lipopolysaccharide transport system permease protein